MNESRTIRISTETMIRGMLLVAAAVLLFIIKDILLLILVSIVIASFVEAGVKLFKSFGITRTLSVPVIFMVVILVLAGIF